MLLGKPFVGLGWAGRDTTYLGWIELGKKMGGTTQSGLGNRLGILGIRTTTTNALRRTKHDEPPSRINPSIRCGRSCGGSGRPHVSRRRDHERTTPRRACAFVVSTTGTMARVGGYGHFWIQFFARPPGYGRVRLWAVSGGLHRVVDPRVLGFNAWKSDTLSEEIVWAFDVSLVSPEP